MDKNVFKIDNLPTQNNRESEMSSSNHSKLKSFFTTCSLVKSLLFGLLCLLAGSVVTFFIVGDGFYAPIDGGIRATVENCLRAHSPNECENHFYKALGDRIFEDGMIDLNEEKLVELLNWTNMKADVTQMQAAVELKRPVEFGKFLQKIFSHLNDVISDL